MKKTKKIADCWTFDGRIFLKTNSNIVKSVTNEEDLQNASSAWSNAFHSKEHHFSYVRIFCTFVFVIKNIILIIKCT